MQDKITLNSGAGGKEMHELISKVIMNKLSNGILEKMDDSAVLPNSNTKRFAITTDSYVVSPLFFEGGDIGRLCISGTVNDLSTSGAKVSAVTLSFIIEEGFEISKLEAIVNSIAATAKEADIKIVTGDTKVVEKGKADGLYINTAAVGFIDDNIDISSYNAKENDVIIITGTIGDHEVALMKAREMIPFDINVKSDVAPLNKKVQDLLSLTQKINVIKDPTRGGLASCLKEISEHSNCEITIEEDKLPINDQVKAVCELTGFEPLYLANEGKFVIIAANSEYNNIKKVFKDACIIGTLGKKTPRLLVKTSAGGIRKMGMLETVQLPRIC